MSMWIRVCKTEDILENGGSAIDAVEAGINYVELLADEFYVGYGGSPNTEGETTLDAMIMWGPSRDVGAAVAKGDGDVMMRFLPTYHTVDLMRQGASPEEAAYQVDRVVSGAGFRPARFALRLLLPLVATLTRRCGCE